MPASSLSWLVDPAAANPTLLKMISGLLAPSTGEVFVEGEAVTNPHGNVGIVFQNSLLLPWRNILANVMLPIDMKGLPRDKYLPRAKDLLKLVGLEGFEKETAVATIRRSNT